jgi:hypothetical protein
MLCMYEMCRSRLVGVYVHALVFGLVSAVVMGIDSFSCSVLRSMMYTTLVHFVLLSVSPSKRHVSTIIVSKVALFRCGGASLADTAKG